MEAKKESEKRKYTTITIPKPMYDKLLKLIKHTGFSSVSDYVTYIIRETLAEIEESRSGPGREKAVKSGIVKKLRALGYV
ncbi:MAG: ribbon-helix-helix domain-containing protein [Candidatus Micrarchaeaceae archaeon]